MVLLERGLAEIARWQVLCSSIDAVVHLAAPTANVDEAAVGDALALTRHLFDALPGRPLSFVFAGSMASVRPPSDGTAIDERSALWQDGDLREQDAYTQMKTLQEQLVRASCRSRGDRLTILRPSNVWDEERWRQACIGPKLGPLWLVVAPTRSLRLVHSSNCVRAFIDAVRAGADDEMNVDDGAVVSAWRYATRIAGWRRHGYLPIPVAGWLFDAVASLAGRVLRVVAQGRRVPGLLIAQRRKSRFGGYRIDTRRVRERIGWQPDLRPYGLPANAR